MRRPGLIVALAVVLSMTTTAASLAVNPPKDARYRVRHGGKVALNYFEAEGTFKGFNRFRGRDLDGAARIYWVHHQKPQGGQLDIEFNGRHRLLLVTHSLDARRWFCSVTTGGGRQTLGKGRSWASVDTMRDCIAARSRWP